MTVHSAVAGTEIAITPTPAAYLGSGAVAKLPGILGGTGSDAAVVVTDAGLAATPVVARVALVAVGGGSPIDAAKGIALAAVNPQRGRDLDYRGQFARRGRAAPTRMDVPTGLSSMQLIGTSIKLIGRQSRGG